MRIPSGTVDQYVYFVAVDATDLKTRETGLSSFTVYRSRNGGAAAAMTTPTVNETDATNMPGVYELLLDEDMTIDAGDDSQEMVFHITQASMAPVTRAIELYRPKITAGNTLSVESDGDATKVNTLDGHTAQTGDSFALIGATGSGLTTLAQAAVCTEARLAELAAANIPADLDLVLADTGELQTDWTNGGRLDLNLDAVLALLDDARAEPGQGAPPVNADAMTKLDYLYKWVRNKKDNDGSTTQLYDDAGTTVDHKQTTSEAGGTVTKGEIVTGP